MGVHRTLVMYFLLNFFFEPLIVITMNAEAFEEQIQNKHELKQET